MKSKIYKVIEVKEKEFICTGVSEVVINGIYINADSADIEMHLSNICEQERLVANLTVYKNHDIVASTVFSEDRKCCVKVYSSTCFIELEYLDCFNITKDISNNTLDYVALDEESLNS